MVNKKAVSPELAEILAKTMVSAAKEVNKMLYDTTNLARTVDNGGPGLFGYDPVRQKRVTVNQGTLQACAKEITAWGTRLNEKVTGDGDSLDFNG